MPFSLNPIGEVYSSNLRLRQSYFSPSQVHSLVKGYKDQYSFYTDLLTFAASLSLCPVSHFSVGCIAVGVSGRHYLGANFEFEGFSLNQTVHAEQAATVMAYVHGEDHLVALYVSAMPCGHCRQFLRENSNYESLQIHVLPQKPAAPGVFLLPDLLPHSFGPEALHISEKLFTKKKLPENYSFTSERLKSVPVDLHELLQSGLRHAFCPYSREPSAVIFAFPRGVKIVGFSLESCAFNPSLSPFQVALIQCLMGGYSLLDVNDIFYLQKEGGLINWCGHLKDYQMQMMPNSRLNILYY